MYLCFTEYPDSLWYKMDECDNDSPFCNLTSSTSLSVDSCHSKVDKKNNHNETNDIHDSTKFDTATGSRHRTYMIYYLRIIAAVFILLLILQFTSSIRSSNTLKTTLKASISPQPSSQIIVITPTYRRSTRLADMTRMANTLSHIKNLYWIVIEDENHKVKAVEKLLNRTALPYTYFPAKTPPGYPRRGWYQRTMALQYLRNHSDLIIGESSKSVVYFADDDNSYDIRLFNDYIRNVQKVGIWAVGFAGGALVESPAVVNGTVVGWNVIWHKKRKFATDMAGFAVALDVVLNSTAVFGKSCSRGLGAPETCFLEDLGLQILDLEPFGFEEKEREILVWHTKTVKVTLDKRVADTNGFFME
ncbi:Galactosylgalactosylxylosylprotein 3-beta-glucuronosyltransferase sqv-8 [Dirofilaria immitis]